MSQWDSMTGTQYASNPPYIDIRKFGRVREGGDITLALVNALEYAYQDGAGAGGLITIPSGQFTHSPQVVPSSGSTTAPLITVCGQGSSTRLFCVPSGNSEAAWTFSAPSPSSNTFQQGMRDLVLIGNFVGIGVSIPAHAVRYVFSNVDATQFDVGFQALTENVSVSFSNCRAAYNRVGFNISGANQMQLSNCGLDGNSEEQLKLTSGHMRWRGGTCQGEPLTHPLVSIGTGAIISMGDIHFEANNGTFPLVSAVAAGNVSLSDILVNFSSVEILRMVGGNLFVEDWAITGEGDVMYVRDASIWARGFTDTTPSRYDVSNCRCVWQSAGDIGYDQTPPTL